MIIGHVNAYTYAGEPNEVYAFSGWIHRFCYAFHMPLFMFVSGGLLYLTRLNRGWSVKRLYADKCKRLLIPYIAFTLIGFLIKIPLSSISKRAVDVSWHGLFSAFFDPANGPLNELWFLGTLMWLMFMYPVYKAILRYGWGELLLLGITLLPFVAGIHIDIDGWLNLKGVSRMAIYFVAGILFFKHNVMAMMNGRLWVPIVLTVAFGVCLIISDTDETLTALAGVLMSFSWAGYASSFPRLFSWFRDHSFQIYLVGIFPQMFVELVVWRHWHAEWMQLPFYLASCLLALACGVLVSKTASKLPWKYLRWCFGVK